MAPLAAQMATMADLLVARQTEITHSHLAPAKDWTPLVVSCVMLFIAWSTIFLRLYTRIRLIFAIGWDDITMMIALLFFTVYAGADIKLSIIRTELEFMSLEQILAAVKAFIVIDVFYCASQVMLKLSVGLFLLRIIVLKRHRYVVYSVMLLSTLWGTATMLFAIFQCGVPKSAAIFMEKRLFNECVSGEEVLGMTFTLAAITALSDFAFTILPIFILKNAQMNKRAKLSLAIILAMGGIGSVASVVRFIYVPRLSKVTNDFFMNSSKLAIWSTLECGLGIAAGSLATLRPLFRRFLSSARNTITTTRNRMSRRYSRVSYPSSEKASGGSSSSRSSTRSSSSRTSHDFFAWKHPFASLRRWSAVAAPSDLEATAAAAAHRRASRTSTSTSASGAGGEVYDGSGNKPAARLGTETTITVGMVQHPAPALYGGHRHKRSFSRLAAGVVALNRSEEKLSSSSSPVRPRTSTGGGIEKKTVFETVSEQFGDGGSSGGSSERTDDDDGASDKDTKYSASVYSQDSLVRDEGEVPEVPKLPKPREGEFF